MKNKRNKYGPKNDLTGQRFGHLEVLRMAHKPGDKRREYRAVCKCHNCGKKEHWVFPYPLKSGKQKSCGCLKGNRKKGKDHCCYKGYKGITGSIWGRIRSSAKKRNLEFSITIKDGWELFEKQDHKCALTGLPIKIGEGRNRCSASIDRIDNTKGYIKDNIQWVHRNINMIKHHWSQEYFISICRRVASNLSLKDIPTLSDDEMIDMKLFVPTEKWI